MKKLKLEDYPEEIKELMKDPRNKCLHQGTARCEDQSCHGYCSGIICTDYVCQFHMDYFNDKIMLPKRT